MLPLCLSHVITTHTCTTKGLFDHMVKLAHLEKTFCVSNFMPILGSSFISFDFLASLILHLDHRLQKSKINKQNIYSQKYSEYWYFKTIHLT